MLTTLRDAQGQIQASCEWVPCDERGSPSNDYSHVFVNQVEVSEGVDLKAIFRGLVMLLVAQAPKATGAYWERLDSTGAGVVKPHAFTRQQLLRFARKQEEVRV